MTLPEPAGSSGQSHSTARGHAEFELVASQARFHTAIEAVAGVLWTNSADGRMVGEQPAWAALTGQAFAEYQGYGWSAAVHPDDAQPSIAAWNEAVAERRAFIFEHRVRRHDGVWRLFAVRAVPRLEEGRIAEWIGVHTDITDQRADRQRLDDLNDLLERRFADALAERKLFADIVDATDAFIQAIDPTMTLIAINRANVAAFERLYGLCPKVGDHLPTLYAGSPALLAGATAYWRRALAGERFAVVAEVGEHARTWVEMGFDVLRDANGRTIGAFSFASDISARFANEKRLAEAEQQLRQSQKMEAVGQLTGGIAHDFNNLLTVVTGNIDMAQRAVAEGDIARAGRTLANALKGAERAATLTSRLLAFSRQQPLDPKPTDVGRLITGMSDLLARTLGEAVLVETIVDAELWRVEVDAPQLENALLNLAINARDAMAGNGRLTIEAANVSVDLVHSVVHSGIAVGQYVAICVDDTGVGMAPEIVERAFDPFFTTKEAGKGTGLGLSQVYGFVKQSGGHVRIDSVPGQGTSVKLYLPRLPGDVEIVAPRCDAAAPSGSGGETILVAEDDDDVRAFTLITLTEFGYRVLGARDADAALRLLDDLVGGPVDLLLTDVIMPGMSGKELADAVRARLPEMPVLFTTGYARDTIVHGGRLDPGINLLTKPFTTATLAAKVREVLDRTRP